MALNLRTFAALAAISVMSSACVITWGEGDFDEDRFNDDDSGWVLDDDGSGEGGSGGAVSTGGTDGSGGDVRGMYQVKSESRVQNRCAAFRV